MATPLGIDAILCAELSGSTATDAGARCCWATAATVGDEPPNQRFVTFTTDLYAFLPGDACTSGCD